MRRKSVRVAVFDLDGVLFDVSERLKRCLEEAGLQELLDEGLNEEECVGRRSLFWRCFLSDRYMYLDKPNVGLVEYVRRLRECGVRIVIVTGRREDTQKDYTLKQLAEAGVLFDEIYFRAPNSFRRDYEFKAGVVKKLLRRGYEVIEFWDDSEAVVNVVRRLLPNARVICYKIVQ